MPSGQEYANRLREEAHRTLAPQVNDLENELNNIKNDLCLSLGQLGHKLDAIRSQALPEVESVVSEAMEEAAREKGLQMTETLAALAHFARQIRSLETQEEILNLLMDAAGKFAPRVALFAVREGRLSGWSSRGFSEKVSEEIRACTFDRAKSPLFQATAETETPATASDVSGEAALGFIREDAPVPWHLFQLRAIGRSIAFLLVPGTGDARVSLESLSALMDITGTCVENIALRIMQEVRSREARQEPAAAEEQEVLPMPEPLQAAPAAAVLEAPAPAEGVAAGDQQAATEGPLQASLAPPPEPVEPAFEQPAEAAIPVPREEQPAAAVQQQPEPVIHEPEQPVVLQQPEPVIAEPEQPVVLQQPEPVIPEPELPVALQQPEPVIPEPEQPVALQQPEPVIPEPELPVALQQPEPVIPEPEQPAVLQQPQPVMPEPEKPAAAAVAEVGAPEAARGPSGVVIEMPPPRPVAPAEAHRAAPGKEVHRLTEEEKLHADAKRFARLLVSEIKLYNEQRVVDGRQNRDIYVRLKKDIDRSRDMYEKRVPHSVTRKIDYFHDEVVRILGENDPSALGSDYPGPRVES